MIILLGPDGSGKTTLAKKLDIPYFHFTQHSTYEDYLKPLCSLEMTNAVLDRHMICEYAYAYIMHREPHYNMKQWHNIILLSLIHNPLIILCTHKPFQSDYSKEQYLPYEQWDDCLALYRQYLSTNHIRYTEYDYAGPISVRALEIMHDRHKDKMALWRTMWQDGIGCIGSAHPKVLLVAERLGPNNMNNLPFETGPTGKMLTDMLEATGTPLGKFAVTNLVKSFRRDTRNPNNKDMELLHGELTILKPQKVVFMGGVAKLGIKVAKELNIEHHEIVHFGYYSHRSITDIRKVPKYLDKWREIMGIQK